jgi:pyridinium-3,5-biscarboxylic acid mononucleotide synthase
MDIDRLKALLESVRSGDVTTEEALLALRSLPFEDVEIFARLDTHRAVRTGLPEVVFCPGKTDDQIAKIVHRLAHNSDRVLATRATEAQFAAVHELTPAARYHPLPNLITVGDPPLPTSPDRYVAVLTAGTADTSVGEEAAMTLEMSGSRAVRCYDIGVAGLHRLLSKLELIQGAHVIIVCAGMEGALASVVGGLVSRPVVAVPTSIGYGASFGGIAALLSMLNSCSGGVAVMNIDNGFGAAVYAHRINSE